MKRASCLLTRDVSHLVTVIDRWAAKNDGLAECWRTSIEYDRIFFLFLRLHLSMIWVGDHLHQQDSRKTVTEL